MQSNATDPAELAGRINPLEPMGKADKAALRANCATLMRARGMGSERLARESKVSKRTIDQILSAAGANPALETIAAIAGALRVSTASLLAKDMAVSTNVSADTMKAISGLFGLLASLNQAQLVAALKLLSASFRDDPAGTKLSRSE